MCSFADTSMSSHMVWISSDKLTLGGKDIHSHICIFFFFLAALGLPSGALGLLLQVQAFSSCRAWALEHAGSVALWHVGSSFPDQGSNPSPRHWEADSQAPGYQGSLCNF